MNNYQSLPDITLAGDWNIQENLKIEFNHETKYLLLNFEGSIAIKIGKKIIFSVFNFILIKR